MLKRGFCLLTEKTLTKNSVFCGKLSRGWEWGNSLLVTVSSVYKGIYERSAEEDRMTRLISALIYTQLLKAVMESKPEENSGLNEIRIRHGPFLESPGTFSGPKSHF